MHTRLALSICLLLVFAGTPALGQSDPPTGLDPSVEPMAAPSTEPMDEAVTDSGNADLWVQQGGTLTRVDGLTGAVIERQEVDGGECGFSGTWPVFMRPDAGALWMIGAVTSEGEANEECFVRVPVDGSEPTVFWMRPRPGREFVRPGTMGLAASGESLIAVAWDGKKNQQSFQGGDERLYRLGTDPDDLQLLQKGVSSVAPAHGDPVGVYLGKGNRLMIGILDPEAGRFESSGDLKLAVGYGLAAGPDGLVANWQAGAARTPVKVYDTKTTSLLGEARAPKESAGVYVTQPTGDGVWIAGLLRNGKRFVYFMPYDSKSVAIDACKGQPKTCDAVLATWTEDAAWVRTGNWGGGLAGWDPQMDTYHRYLNGAAEPSLSVPGTQILLPYESPY